MVIRTTQSTLLDQLPWRYLLVLEDFHARHTSVQRDLRSDTNHEKDAKLEEVSLEEGYATRKLRFGFRQLVGRAEAESGYPFVPVDTNRGDRLAIKRE